MFKRIIDKRKSIVLQYLKIFTVLILYTNLSSCASVLYTYGSLAGMESPMRGPYPLAKINIETKGKKLNKKTKFALFAEKDRVSDFILMRFTQALQTKGFSTTSLESADYVIHLSCLKTSLKVEITQGGQCHWEGIATFARGSGNEWNRSRDWINWNNCTNWEEEKEPLLLEHKSNTIYGHHRFLRVDYLITALIDNFGSQVTSSIEIHPKEFEWTESH